VAASAPGSATVIQGDARHLPLPDASVDLIVTSPPYWKLRDYRDDGGSLAGQIGNEPSPAEYLDALLACTAEWARVLKPGGNMFVNLGDKYSSGNSGQSALAEVSRERFDGGGHTAAKARQASAPAKGLLMLPERYRIGCADQLGLIPRAVIVWAKTNPTPESVGDRVARAHEDWVHLVKQPRHFAAVDEIREPHTWGRVFNPAWADQRRRRGLATQGRPGKNDGFHSRNLLGALPGSVWNMATEPLVVPDHVAHARCCGGTPQPGCEDGLAHYAAFPTTWPLRLILGWSPGGVCSVCGEGRRPVTDRARMPDRPGRVQGRPVDALLGAHGPDGRAGSRYATAATITGYVCDCNAPIRTPTGTGRADDPSLATGRAGLNRPRAADGGQRITTRWEQRHYARQLAASPHLREMQAELPGPVDHYRKTSTSSGRPLPADVLDRWLARGWLTPAPPFEPPPTTPAVVLDPFGGSGTVALVAKVLGRRGIAVELSGDYCKLARWRCNDPTQAARVLKLPAPPAVSPEQPALFGS
jgi:DNA modification methylase